MQNLHPIRRKPNANFIQLAASRMQISLSRLPAGCKFHSVGYQPDANCIQVAALQYKIPKFINVASGRRPTEWNLHPAGGQPDTNFAEISGKHAGTTFFQIKTWTEVTKF
jgi:hypothetical protein